MSQSSVLTDKLPRDCRVNQTNACEATQQDIGALGQELLAQRLGLRL